jgi:hypothetical protein
MMPVGDSGVFCGAVCALAKEKQARETPANATMSQIARVAVTFESSTLSALENSAQTSAKPVDHATGLCLMCKNPLLHGKFPERRGSSSPSHKHICSLRSIVIRRCEEGEF